MNFKKSFSFFVMIFVCFCSLQFISCGSSVNVADRKTTVENVDKMFWAVNGYDKKGKPSTVYLFGTIHVGKEDLFPYADSINRAIARSDRFAAEISSANIEKIQTETIKLIGQSFVKAKGRSIKEQLTDEQWSVIDRLIGNAAMAYVRVEPWVLNTALVQELYKTSGLSSDWGIDFNLMAYLKKEKKSWDGLDELETQLNILTFGSYDEQLWVLKQDIDQILNPEELNKHINALYEAYVKGDAEALNTIAQQEPGKNDETMKEFVKSYEKALITDRNQKWAYKIRDYLNQGGKTFIFAGAQHFCGEESVFHYLKEYGITE